MMTGTDKSGFVHKDTDPVVCTTDWHKYFFWSFLNFKPTQKCIILLFVASLVRMVQTCSHVFKFYYANLQTWSDFVSLCIFKIQFHLVGHIVSRGHHWFIAPIMRQYMRHYDVTRWKWTAMSTKKMLEFKSDRQWKIMQETNGNGLTSCNALLANFSDLAWTLAATPLPVVCICQFYASTWHFYCDWPIWVGLRKLC